MTGSASVVARKSSQLRSFDMQPVLSPKTGRVGKEDAISLIIPSADSK